MKVGFINIPDRPWFKIDEVSTITGVKEYILKFWEKEFEEISPEINASYESLYSKSDVETMLNIKALLFDKKLTIDEAKIEIKAIHSLGNERYEVEVDTVPVSEEDEDDVKAQINILSRKLTNILSITDTVKSSHNWI